MSKRNPRKPRSNGRNDAHCHADDVEVIRQRNEKRDLLAKMRDRIHAKPQVNTPKTPAR
ncbi:hypothetical protein [Streptomyces gilvosporeus]|uniref:hypothetical protein n=1 Tax=Streptomyces gilvosporeus TaxID=553510 RepID=UPI00131C31C4|nr:hypothetical protein [Streptomyces gilvosporeus]